MVRSTDMFMKALEEWLAAVRANDFDNARLHAEQIVLNGQMLVGHPDFVACFKRYNPTAEPMDALVAICQFMVAATDGRARVLNDWVSKNLPANSTEYRR